jgi:hypothetical protein
MLKQNPVLSSPNSHMGENRGSVINKDITIVVLVYPSYVTNVNIDYIHDNGETKW